MAHRRAANTTRTYATFWKSFDLWCAAHGSSSLPARPETLIAYLTACKDRYSSSAVTIVLAAVKARHADNLLKSPTEEPVVREYVKALRRVIGGAQRRKTAVESDKLRRIIDAIEGPTSLRDRALLLTGFAGAFRRSELVSLRWEDLERHPQGLLVLLRRSKTDQEGKGRRVRVPTSNDATYCPVRALEALRAESSSVVGPIFLSADFHRGGEPLSPQGVARVVKRWVEKAGYDPEEFSGHSLRRGFVTAAVQAGQTLDAIRQQTGHKRIDTLAKYVEEHGSWDKHAGKGLL